MSAPPSFHLGDSDLFLGPCSPQEVIAALSCTLVSWPGLSAASALRDDARGCSDRAGEWPRGRLGVTGPLGFSVLFCFLAFTNVRRCIRV